MLLPTELVVVVCSGSCHVYLDNCVAGGGDKAGEGNVVVKALDAEIAIRKGQRDAGRTPEERQREAVRRLEKRRNHPRGTRGPAGPQGPVATTEAAIDTKPQTTD